MGYDGAEEICLKDLILLGLPATDVFLVHATTDVGFIPTGDLPWLSRRGKEQFAALLNANVISIECSEYGTQLKLDGVDSHVLEDYEQSLDDESRGRMTGMLLPKQVALFDITSDGQRKLYAAEAVHSAQEALDLWEVHTGFCGPWDSWAAAPSALVSSSSVARSVQAMDFNVCFMLYHPSYSFLIRCFAISSMATLCSVGSSSI